MSPKPILPILDRAKEMLDYDPETGVFTWRKPHRRPHLAGKEAGGSCSQGYRRIKIDGTLYSGHRLAWAWFHNEEPPVEVDHINQDKSDNRIENLRNGEGSVNLINRPIRPNNTTGVAGVKLNRDGVYVAQFHSGYLNSSKDFFEAVCARKSAENQFWSTA
jgi:hypothetical protein